MKVKIGDTVYDLNEVPFAIVFNNDQERQRMTSQLTNMKPKHGERVYAMVPEGHFEDRAAFEKWATT